MPVVLVEANDREAMEIAIIENVQRADLNALEEAAGYEQLIADYQYTQSDLAKVIGKSRSHVANTLRLTKLPESIREHVVSGNISAGHARALLSVSDPEAVSKRIVAEGLSVRDVERIVQSETQAPSSASPAKTLAQKDPDTRALEKALEDVLGLVVSIEHKSSGHGVLKISYKTLEQLDNVCHRLKH